MELRAREVCRGVSEETEAEWKSIRSGWYLGGTDFRDRLNELASGAIQGRKRESYARPLLEGHDHQTAAELLKRGLRALKLTKSAARRLRQGDPQKQGLAWLVKSQTVVGDTWIQTELAMGHRSNVSRAIIAFRQTSDPKENGFENDCIYARTDPFSQKARTNLDLDRVARALNARDTATVRFLPTEAFAETVQEAVHSAHSRIWILAYYISGGSHETIQAIYDTVRQKARAGLDTMVLSEFGKGTPMPIRNATLNYANTLQDDGIKVRFIQEYRTMHKKVILVDQDKTFLGSANLTGFGVSHSDEFSVLIHSEPFARNVEADINRMRIQSQAIEQLKY